MPAFYAVRCGITPGIYSTWDECKQNVLNVPFSVYKKFSSERDAIAFVNVKTLPAQQTHPKKGFLVDQDIQTCFRKVRPPKEGGLSGETPRPSILHVYTDGSCHGNGTAHAKAGIGVFFGAGDTRNRSEPVYGTTHTNNVAELQAICRALEIIQTTSKGNLPVQIIVHSDSMYAIRCVTTYGNRVVNTNMNDVPNAVLIKNAIAQVQTFPFGILTFKHIRAHTSRTDIHSRGNAAADMLAKGAVEN
jgi:ribonuclease HI